MASGNTGGKGGQGGVGGGLVAGIVAGGIFLLFWLVLDLPFLAGVGAAALAMGAVLVMVRGLRKDSGTDSGPAIGEYVDKDLARKVVAEAKAAAASLETSCEAMEAGPVRNKFRKLAEGLGKIASDVVEDPRDAVAASLFLSNQGEAALRMSRLYLRLRKGGQAQGDNQATLSKLDGVLDRMIAATELELSNLQADEWDELRMEMDFMEGEQGGSPAGTPLGGL